MKQDSDDYNLLEQPWIPILWTNGKFGRVGIRKALTEAGRIRQIAASNPMDRLAILRFLLALLYWCRGSPRNKDRDISGDSFPASWFDKLQENHHCFNLLGERKRFYQCKPSGGARPPEKLSANYLIHEVPTGTNKWHFRHSTDEVDGLCLACCTMGLLRLPLFATSGGRGKPPGINAKPPIYVTPLGASLAATLRLLWRPAANLGTPSWEKPDLDLPKKGEVPLLTGLTWLPRRVWLSNPDESDNPCISCGMKKPLVRQSVFAGIGSTKIDAENSSRVWHDPHVAYAMTSKGDPTPLHASDALGVSDAAASQWAKIIAATLLRKNTLAKGNSAWAVGFSTVQNDKYLEAMEQMITDPCAEGQIHETIERIEKWRKEGSTLARRLRTRSNKASSRKHTEIGPMLDAVRPHVEDRVSVRTGELLAGGNDEWERAAREYRPMMGVLAKSLWPGFTTAAIARREQIALVQPDMRPQGEAGTKPSKSKRGNK